MWQHCFNSAVFRRRQPDTKTLWGGPRWQEGHTRETGLKSLRFEFVCNKITDFYSRWLPTSFEGEAMSLTQEGKYESNLIWPKQWCDGVPSRWNTVTMIYTQAWKYLSSSWKDIQGQYLRFWSEVLAVCDDLVVVICHCTLYWNTQTRIELSLLTLFLKLLIPKTCALY